MRRPLPPFLLLPIALLPALARAESSPLERLGDGAALYAAVRPAAAAALAAQLGLGQVHELKQLQERFGINPLDPGLLAPLGIDAAAPIVASLFELPDPPPGRASSYHHRLVASAEGERLLVFLSGMASSKSSPIQVFAEGSREARQGVRAAAAIPGAVAILRLARGAVVVDAVQSFEGKLPSPLELAKRWSLDPPHPLSAAPGGARRLIAPDAAASLYVDGRRLPSLMATTPLAELKPDAAKPDRAAARRDGARCEKAWAGAPAVYDDLAGNLTAEPHKVTLKIAWGGPPTRLKLPVTDDAPVDIEGLSRGAFAAIALHASSLAPLYALPRSGPLAPTSGDLAGLYGELDRCGRLAWLLALVRHWPELVAVALSQLQASGGASLVAVLGRLRNLALVLRELSDQGAQWAAIGTFEAAARPAIELAFASAGQPETLTFGARKPGVYPLTALGLSSGVLGLEDLASGPLLVVASDSSKTLAWVYRPKRPPPDMLPPLLAFELDGAKLAGLAIALEPRAEPSLLTLALAHLGRIQGTVGDERDLLLMSVSAPLP